MIRWALACSLMLPSLADSASAQETAKLLGLCFTAFRDNESPALALHPLPSSVDEDVKFASRATSAIRTYTVQSSSYLIAEFCTKYEIDCLIGAWIGPERWRNDAEIELLIHQANQGNPRIKAVIVGNEVLHRGDLTETQLLNHVAEVKAAVPVPVAVADTWTAWLEHPALAAAVDICGVQIYPYWEGKSIEGAAQYTVERVQEIQRRYPDKRVILTEFGWPTAGGSLGEAVASPEAAARYLREILPLLDQHKIEYYYFGLWDEKWKQGPEGGVGPNWGLFTAEGSPKPAFMEFLPTAVRAGQTRPPRTLTFTLPNDQERNNRLAIANGEGVVGEPTPPAQRGPGLESTRESKFQNPYASPRPPAATPPVDPDDQARKPPQARRLSPLPHPGPLISTATLVSPIIAQISATKPPLHGLCLSLFRDRETPHEGILPLLSEIREDVQYAGTLARTVRCYSATGPFSFLPEICENAEVDCIAGSALGPYPWLNDFEIEMLIRLGRGDNPRLKAVIVGNEVMHRGDFSVEQYIQYLRKVKAAVHVPVATAELLHTWLEHPELAAEVDILGVQIYPYWGGLSIDKAAADTLDRVRELQARHPDKRVILTEFGWPTAGGTIGGAEASPENTARYLREVLPLLDQAGIEYLYFAMTDEQWKSRDEGGPGPHWGLLTSDGQVKPELIPLFPQPASPGMKRSPRKLTYNN